MIYPLASMLGPLTRRRSSAAAAFVPTDIAGLTLWLDAGTISGSDGDLISTWADSSGNGNDAAQATSGFRPTLQTNEANGLPVVRFDGSNDRLKTAAFSAALTASTIFIFGKGTGTSVTTRFIDGLTSGTRQHMLYVGGQYWMFAGVDLHGGSADTNFHAMTSTFNGASSALYVDGLLIASGSAGTQDMDGAIIGNDYSETAPHAGDIAEVIIYNSVLSSEDRASVEAYLATKYAL